MISKVAGRVEQPVETARKTIVTAGKMAHGLTEPLPELSLELRQVDLTLPVDPCWTCSRRKYATPRTRYVRMFVASMSRPPHGVGTAATGARVPPTVSKNAETGARSRWLLGRRPRTCAIIVRVGALQVAPRRTLFFGRPGLMP